MNKLQQELSDLIFKVLQEKFKGPDDLRAIPKDLDSVKRALLDHLHAHFGEDWVAEGEIVQDCAIINICPKALKGRKITYRESRGVIIAVDEASNIEAAGHTVLEAMSNLSFAFEWAKERGVE